MSRANELLWRTNGAQQDFSASMVHTEANTADPLACFSIYKHRFLLSTHYTHYAPFAFFVNLVATVINLIAKLPSMHQVRLFDINQKVEGSTE